MKFIDAVKSLFIYKEPADDNTFILENDKTNIKYDVRREQSDSVKNVYKNYDDNLNYIENVFSYPTNNDVVIRKIKIFDNTKAFLVFYDGMVDTEMIDLAVIKTLLEIPHINEETKENEIIEKLVAHSQSQKTKDFDKIIDEVNFGSCGLFIDGISFGFIIDVRKWGNRGVQKPEIEQSLYGPQESFSEIFRINSALVRKTLKTEKAKIETI